MTAHAIKNIEIDGVKYEPGVQYLLGLFKTYYDTLYFLKAPNGRETTLHENMFHKYFEVRS